MSDERLLYFTPKKSNSPWQVTVHRESCRHIYLGYGPREFRSQDWPKSPGEYYVIGCNHCRPTLPK